MKNLLIIFILFTTSQTISAMPIKCSSFEKVGEKPSISFKISQNKPSYALYRHLSSHLVGLTLHTNERHVLSSDLRISERTIHGSFVRAGWLVGHLNLDISPSGQIQGEFKYSDAGYQAFEVECIDLAQQ